jgi:transcriptional regulator GlxA family with amidase domain
MEIAILLYPNMTALDAVGPYDVLSRLPRAQVKWVATNIGPIRTDSGLGLMADYFLEEVARPDIVIVPGGQQHAAAEDQQILRWLQTVHRTTRYTTSVCTGALILGAAGLLRGVPATTYWGAMSQLRRYGAKPVRKRFVHHGKIVTAAGVSAGIDMALYLAAQLAGSTVAKVIQLAIEYDPQPPFSSGSPAKASLPVKLIARIALAFYNRR